MNKIINTAIVFILILSLLVVTGCKENHENKTDDNNQSIGNDSKSAYPVTLKNAGKTITFNKKPQRVVALMQQDAEVLVALGLADKLVGYSLVSEQTPEKFKKQLKDIPVLAKRIPSKEVIFNSNPDLIIGGAATFTDNNMGTRSWLNKLGINTYVTKSNHPATIQNQVYKQIRDMAKIFNVKRRGKQVIQNMQSKIDNIKNKIGNIQNPLKVVYLAGGKGSAPQAAGGDSLDSYLIKLAGGKNIFAKLNGYLVQISWEKIIEKNPDVIVISYCCGSSPKPLIEQIKNKHAMQNVSAVKNNRFVKVQVEETTGSMRIPVGLEKLARGFYPKKFK